MQRLQRRIRNAFLSRMQGEVRDGIASIKRTGTNPAPAVTVGLRLIELCGKRGFFLIHLQESPYFDFTKDCREFYRRSHFSISERNMTRAIEGYCVDGFARANIHQCNIRGESDRHLSDYGLVLTHFKGVNLNSDWGHGAEIASALACLRALGKPRTTEQLGVTGWEEYCA